VAAAERDCSVDRTSRVWIHPPQVIEDFEAQMKEAVNEDQATKRRAELTWKIHRLHWEKNRFIFDLMYQRKVMSRELVRLIRGGEVPQVGASCSPSVHVQLRMQPVARFRSLCTSSPPHRPFSHVTHDMCACPCAACLHAQYDYLVREKVADGALISKWRKPGYEILCSMLAIQKVRCFYLRLD
jgi:hypothetical protein